jgi:Tfp pilus assembly protein PilF
VQELTQRGVSALKTGDRIEAYRLLSQAVKEQPDDAYAWLWLSGAVND